MGQTCRSNLCRSSLWSTRSQWLLRAGRSSRIHSTAKGNSSPLKGADLPEFPNPDEIDLTLTVGAQGQLSGMARVPSGGKDHDYPLLTQAPRARINPQNANLTANIFIESIPKPRIFAVHPPHL